MKTSKSSLTIHNDTLLAMQRELADLRKRIGRLETLDSVQAITGSFTPSIRFGGASVGITYSTQTGQYWKHGSMVRVFARMVLSSKGSSTGTVDISGLPFASGEIGSLPMLGHWGLTTAISSLLIFPQQGLTTCLVRAAAAAGSTAPGALSNTDFGNTSSIVFAGWYLAES